MKLLHIVISLLMLCLSACASEAKTPATPVQIPEPPAQTKPAARPEIVWIAPSQVKIPDDKIVMIFVGTDTYHWCVELKENFTDAEVVSLVNEIFYPVYIDAIKEPELARALVPSMEVPTLVFFTAYDIFMLPGLPPTIDMLSTTGYIPKEELLQRLLEAVAIITSKHGETPSSSQP